MQSCSQKSSIEHSFHSFVMCILMGAGWSRTMTQSIISGGQNHTDDEDVDWWKTPAESPNLNPIECMWHEMKEYIRRRVKPTTKQ